LRGPKKKANYPISAGLKVAKKKWQKLPDFGHFFIGEIARNYPEKKWPKIGFAASKTSSSKQHKKKSNTNIQKHRTLSISPHSSRRRRVLV